METPLFGSKAMLNSATLKSARNIIRNSLKLRPDETVLIITDYTRIPIADVLSFSVMELNGDSSRATEELSISLMAPREAGKEEPPKCVANAMKRADVILIPTKTSLTFTDATREATANARIGSMPAITEKMMIDGGLTGDFSEIKLTTARVAETLETSNVYRVTSPNKTDITFNRANRKIFRDDGDLSEKGRLGNLPAGEACLAIAEESANGILVVDRIGEIVTSATRLTVENGRIVNVSGDGGHAFKGLLKSARDAGYGDPGIIAEFGVGTNTAAKYLECEVETEKMYGTVHFGIGGNEPIGGVSKITFHHDGLILDATLEIDNKLVLEGRRFYI